MTNTNVLRRAIRDRLPITFKYVREGKVYGMRGGNPHALFYDPRHLLRCDLYQTIGVSDSGEEVPSWREFDVEDMHEVELMSHSAHFRIAEGYNPDASRYIDAVERIIPELAGKTAEY